MGLLPSAYSTQFPSQPRSVSLKSFEQAGVFRRLPSLGVLALLLAGSVPLAHSQGRIITWGPNTREWNRALGLDAFRMGCSSAPAECVRVAARLANDYGVERIFLAIRLDAGTTAAHARVYSAMSRDHRFLYEVGFDDFVGQSQRQKESFSELSASLREIARQLKSANPDLKFGLTIYMDQISSSRFPLDRLDAEFRQHVDYVHLYAHYRKEPETFEAATRKVIAIFPNAQVIGGIYAYDRRDYLPCTRGNSAKCTNEEELSLFKQEFQERWDMLQRGKIPWIEFYPANFGQEEQWSGWKQARSCRPDRLRECVANTEAMRRFVRQSVSQQPFPAP